MTQEAALADLKAKVGTETHRSEWVTVDQERIDLFAEATGDHQWIHVDIDRAKKESPYQDTIAHSFLTLSLLPWLTREEPEDQPRYPGVKLGVNYGLNRVRFPAPIKVNSRVRTITKLTDISEVQGGLQLVREVTVEVEGLDKPACVAETISRLYF